MHQRDGNSGVYRDLTALVQAGLIQNSDGKKYGLTAAGKKACPDEGTFERVSEAVSILEQTDPSPKRQLILGTLMLGPKTCGDVLKYLADKKFISPMAQSQVYREIKAFVAEGLVRELSHGMFELTDTGKKSCPDEGTYNRIGEASKTLLEINVSSPESAEMPMEDIILAKKAALSLARLSGVVAEDVLAPIRALLSDYEKKI